MADAGLIKVAEFQDMIGRMDRKANFLLAAVTFLTGFMADGAGVLFVGAMGCALVALIAAVVAVWPRTPMRGNDLSWVSMATMDERQIRHHLGSVTEDVGLDVVATHLKTLAVICRSKVRAIRLCSVFLVVSVGLSFLDRLI